MSGANRDRAVERLLAVPPAGHAPDAGACVDAEAVAAWLDGGLSGGAADAFESHVSACASCQELLATVVRMTPVEASAAPGFMTSSVSRRSWRTWATPLAAAAVLALVVWTMRPGDSRVAAPATPKEESQIARFEAPEPLSTPESRAVPASPAASPRAVEDKAEVRKKTEAAPVERAEQAEREVAAPSQPNQVDRQAAKVEEKAVAPAAAAPATVPAAAAAAAAAPPRADAPTQGAANGTPARLRRAADATAPAEIGQTQVLRDLAASAGVAVQSPGGESRWRVSRTVEFSSDGGATWRPVTGAGAAPPSDILAGASPAVQTAWLVGRRGLVLLSVDGLRFEVRAPPATVDLTAVQATDRTTALVRAATGQAWRTADGGRTWTPVP